MPDRAAGGGFAKSSCDRLLVLTTRLDWSARSRTTKPEVVRGKKYREMSARGANTSEVGLRDTPDSHRGWPSVFPIELVRPVTVWIDVLLLEQRVLALFYKATKLNCNLSNDLWVSQLQRRVG